MCHPNSGFKRICLYCFTLQIWTYTSSRISLIWLGTYILCLLQYTRHFYWCHQPAASYIIKITPLWASEISCEKGDTDLCLPVCYKMWCDIVIYNKKYTCHLHPHFWHRFPKTLRISCDESYKVSLVILMKQLLEHTQGWRLLSVEPTSRLEGWNFQSHLSIFWGWGRGRKLNWPPMAKDLIRPM